MTLRDLHRQHINAFARHHENVRPCRLVMAPNQRIPIVAYFLALYSMEIKMLAPLRNCRQR